MESISSHHSAAVSTTSNNKCLICDCDVDLSKLIKRERTTAEEEESDNSNATAETITADLQDPAPSLLQSSKADSFCKLLSLSSPKFMKDLQKISFCSACCDAIDNVTRLFGQISDLQSQIDQHRGRIEAQLKKCYIEHVLGFKEDGRQKKITRTRSRTINFNEEEGIVTINHVCTTGRKGNRKSKCSIAAIIRETIVSDLQACEPDIAAIIPDLSEDWKSGGLLRKNPAEEKISKATTSKLKAVSKSSRKIITKNDISQLKKAEIPADESCQSDGDGDDNDNVSLNGLDNNDNDNWSPGEEELNSSKPAKLSPPLSLVSSSPIADKTSVKRKRVVRKRKAPSTSSPSSKKSKRRTAPAIKVQCTECDEVFPNEFKQRQHLVKQHEVAPFPFFCARCGKRFYNQLNLETHLKRQGGECKKNILPETCSVITGRGALKFQCNICQLAVTSRTRLQYHLIVHTKERAFVCDICGESFGLRTTLKQHKILRHFEGKEHPFKCSFENCGKIFGNNFNLEKHEKVHRQEFDFCCSSCNFKAVTLGKLNAHIQVVHSGIRRYKCDQCENTFKKSDKLKRHIYTAHTSEADKPFRCQYCDKGFGEKYKLTRHEIIHTNEKPKVCQVCGKTFAVQDYLRIHMATHDGIGRKRPAKKSSVAAVAAVAVADSDGSDHLIPDEPTEVEVVANEVEVREVIGYVNEVPSETFKEIFPDQGNSGVV